MLRLLVEPAASVDVFGSKVWGRQPLVKPAGADGPVSGGPADTFGLAAADELLSRHGLRTPFVRLARDGSVLADRTFTRGAGKGASVPDQVDPGLVLRQLADGATVVLQGLHRVWEPVAELARGLVADLGHPVQVNAYLTPAGAQGFGAHYDTHDVFVVQLAGGKDWTVHPPVVADPDEG